MSVVVVSQDEFIAERTLTVLFKYTSGGHAPAISGKAQAFLDSIHTLAPTVSVKNYKNTAAAF